MRNSSSWSYSEYQAQQLMSILLRKRALFAEVVVLLVWLSWELSYFSSQPWQSLSWNAISVLKETKLNKTRRLGKTQDLH